VTLVVDRLGVTLGPAVLVRDVSLTVTPGVLHALIGESGSGKTSVARALCALAPAGAEVTGRALLDGLDVLAQRSPRVVWVPQDALGALDPVQSVGGHLAEALEVHRGVRGPARQGEVAALLASVGLEGEARLLGQFPHQLSGGMRQRVLLAAALAADPSVLLADEPTTALDEPLRVQLLELLRGLAAQRGMGVVVITHDLGLVAQHAHQVSVMYGGTVVEHGLASAVCSRPRHPYTRALLAARAFEALAGAAPSATEALPGCRFAPRCARVSPACQAPPVFDGAVACFHPEPA
jgi:oligopeptide/dipeptide ABC transporter ATP-binding protein